MIFEDIVSKVKFDSDYRHLLDVLSVDIFEDEYYLRVGTPSCDQGWILHITIVPIQFAALCENVFPVLLSYGVPFKVVKSKRVHDRLNSGMYGLYKIGKVITVFLDRVEIIEPLLERLIHLTKGLVGPKVLTDLPISDIISARYGSFILNIETDPLGNKVRLMRDDKGSLIFDQYYSPPIQPYWASNPFRRFTHQLPKPPKVVLIANKYLPLQVLKSDTKGDVLVAAYLSRFLFLKKCVIKQGRRGMLPDKMGRDLRDRLLWQCKVSNLFSGSIRMPEMLEFVEYKGESFLIMKYIKKAKELRSIIDDKLGGKIWREQPKETRIKMLGYFLQICNGIEVMHNNGYVHRDITGTNFLVDKNNMVYLIDLELLYSLVDRYPEPPFGLGTYGYMSREQLNSGQPAISDDVYSLGALLCKFVTGGMEPFVFIDMHDLSMKEKLAFFCGHSDFQNLIFKSLSNDPEERPKIRGVKEKVDKYIRSLEGDSFADAPPVYHSYCQIEDAINHGIRALGNDLFVSDGLWFSKIDNKYDWEVYPLRDRHVFGGLYRGVGGVMWVLAKLKVEGYDIKMVLPNIKAGICFMESVILAKLHHWVMSLHYGQAGFALVLANIKNSELDFNSLDCNGYINDCFNKVSPSINILEGIAGQGLAIMQCKQFLDRDCYFGKLNEYVSILINSQQLDGSWVSKGGVEQSEKITGFGYGIAGVIYFLLEYSNRVNHKGALASAEKGLKYLIANCIKKKDFVTWTHSDKDEIVGLWWCHGAPGISLSFLKAYEITKNVEYREVAERALMMQPAHFICSNLSQCHGLSGLGEIYLEAFRVIRNQEWYDRATWIANVIMAMRRKDGPNSCYWWAENVDFPTADFMIGHSGVLHFLLRYLHPESVFFPLLPEPLSVK